MKQNPCYTRALLYRIQLTVNLEIIALFLLIRIMQQDICQLSITLINTHILIFLSYFSDNVDSNRNNLTHIFGC